MSKFNEKSETIVSMPTEVNYMGENAFKMAAVEELVSTVMTTFLSDAYYESENEIVWRIKKLIEDVDCEFVAKLAIYARNDGNLRSVSHLLAALIANRISGTPWAKNFYKKIVVRPDDMSEILSAYASINGMSLDSIKKIPNAMKRGFKKALENLDPYQIDKYKMNNKKVSLIDLVRLFHPKGNNKNDLAFEYLIKGISLDGLYSSSILEKEFSKAGQDAKNGTEEDKKKSMRDALINVMMGNKNGMPIMNLIRNLRNIMIYAPDLVDEACRQIRNDEKIINSRLLPFRFVSAYQEIEKFSLTKAEKKIVFENDNLETEQNKILNALEYAIQVSATHNIPVLNGNVAILCDDSGSMRGSFATNSLVSAFSSTRTSVIGHLFASMVAKRQDNVYIGLFGDKLINVPYDRSKGILEFTEHLNYKGRQCGPATEKGIFDFMHNVIEENTKIDNVIVFSDCQIGSGHGFTNWYGIHDNERGDDFHELFKKFKKVNPKAKFIVVNLRQYGSTTVFDKNQNIVNIAGWSDKIFDIIGNHTKGFDGMIKEIEKININD